MSDDQAGQGRPLVRSTKHNYNTTSIMASGAPTSPSSSMASNAPAAAWFDHKAGGLTNVTAAVATAAQVSHCLLCLHLLPHNFLPSRLTLRLEEWTAIKR